MNSGLPSLSSCNVPLVYGPETWPTGVRGHSRHFMMSMDQAEEVILTDAGWIVETGAPASFFKNPKTERAQQFLQRYVVERGS